MDWLFCGCCNFHIHMWSVHWIPQPQFHDCNKACMYAQNIQGMLECILWSHGERVRPGSKRRRSCSSATPQLLQKVCARHVLYKLCGKDLNMFQVLFFCHIGCNMLLGENHLHACRQQWNMTSLWKPRYNRMSPCIFFSPTFRIFYLRKSNSSAWNKPAAEVGNWRHSATSSLGTALNALDACFLDDVAGSNCYNVSWTTVRASQLGTVTIL